MFPSDFQERAAAQMPPPGFVPLSLNQGFLAVNGPVFGRRDADGGVTFGCRILPEMCNPMDAAHGGWIATLFDLVLPLTARLTVDDLAARYLLTVNLSVDYLAGPRIGDWVEGRGRILRRTKRMMFIDGLLTVRGELMARGSGVFRVGPDGLPISL